MTEQEYQDAQNRANAEMHKRQQEYLAGQAQLRQAQYWAEKTQQEINNTQRQKYAAIVAVDENGAFSKSGQIPWHYPEDFKWFQNHTRGNICVMGRVTYDDINARLGEKAIESVLPNRRCFVVTSTELPRNNATAVASISDVDLHLTFEDAETKTVFFCGGEQIYREAIAKCDTVYITAVNKDVDGDRFFPVNYVLKHFSTDKVFKSDTAPDLRFTIWKRNP